MGNKPGRVGSPAAYAAEKPPERKQRVVDWGAIKPNEKNAKILGDVPLLRKFTEEERAKLGGVLEEQSYRDGEVIIKQGDWGHGFYIVIEGEAIVMRQEAERAQPEIIGALKNGDYFGEAALINECRRGATVVAKGPLNCFYLDRDYFAVLFSRERLNVQFAKRNAISAEIADPNKRYSLVAPVGAVTLKDPKLRKLITEAVRGNLLFEGLSYEHKNLIVDRMWKVDVHGGTAVIKQGDRGDNFYVVQSGLFEVVVTRDSKSTRVATRGPGTCFGELALMYNAPRAATVTAIEASVVWTVDRFTFRRILANISDQQLHDYEEFLSKVELLTPLSSRERAKIAEALEEVSYSKGEVIATEGEKGDCMYLLRSGNVSCTIEGCEVKHYSPGDYFGERALLKDEPRAASLSAITDVTLLKLDRAAFALLLGPLEDIMAKRVEGYRRVSRTESKSVMNSELSIHELTFDVKMEELQTVGVLGRGSFGIVKLVKDSSGKTYALKAVNKAQIVQTGQQGHIMSEKRVMAALDHPFLIHLYQTYKDKDRLYFLLEPCLGGELFSVLRARTIFDEDTARFYAAQVIEAFEYMHSKGIVYRDLKPENLLLDNGGYLKITDFGFAKFVTGRTYTLCGTPDYLAPEIVAGKGHGKGVDWWTLGILIYEMLASYPPFYDEDPMKTYAKIMHGKISFPSHFSKEAVSLVSKLLHHKPTKRIGVVKGGAQNIKEHPWFAGFDWAALLDKRVRAPIVPSIKHSEDLSNFDEYGEGEDIVEPFVPDGTDWDADF